MPRGDRRRAQEARQKAEEEEARLFMEAIDWICDNSVNSYYEFALHCYRERPEWVPFLHRRNDRAILATYTREMKRTKNKEYARPLEDVMKELREVEREYYAKQREAQREEMERLRAEFERNLESQT